MRIASTIWVAAITTAGACRSIASAVPSSRTATGRSAAPIWSIATPSNPKRYGDFNVIRPTGKDPDSNRADRERALGLSGGTNRPRELNNDSVRDWQSRRDRDNRNDRVDPSSGQQLLDALASPGGA